MQSSFRRSVQRIAGIPCLIFPPQPLPCTVVVHGSGRRKVHLLLGLGPGHAVNVTLAVRLLLIGSRVA